MKKLSILLSLTTKENDYQQEQAKAAEDAAHRLGIGLQIVYADNDAITQSQQLLEIIQSKNGLRPDAIILEPVGTGLPFVARAAAAAGIGWVVLNRDVDYITELRRTGRAPVFGLSSDHVEVGRMQGRQFAKMLPDGGNVLYIQGPASSSAALQRTEGMNAKKPSNIQVRMLKGAWTEESGHKAILAWMRLSTSRETRIDLIAAQNDDMAIGARHAFEEQMTGAERERWLNLPYTGCDGLPATGREWVRKGLLTATICIPPNAGQAIEMLAKCFSSGNVPPEVTFTVPSSFPPVESLSLKQVR